MKVIGSERSGRLAIAYGSVHVSSLAIGLFGRSAPLRNCARAKVGHPEELLRDSKLPEYGMSSLCHG